MANKKSQPCKVNVRKVPAGLRGEGRRSWIEMDNGFRKDHAHELEIVGMPEAAEFLRSGTTPPLDWYERRRQLFQS